MKYCSNVFPKVMVVVILFSAIATPTSYIFADTIVVDPPGTAGDVIGTDGDDSITVNSGATVGIDVNGQGGNDTIIINDGGVVSSDVLGEEGNDKITIKDGGTVGNNIEGGTDNDEITIESGATIAGSIFGNEGEDTIVVSQGAVIADTDIEGDDNSDQIIIAGTARGVDGGDGSDIITIEGTGQAGDVWGDFGDDTITLKSGANVVYHIDADDGNDTIIIESNVTIGTGVNGSLGEDTIVIGENSNVGLVAGYYSGDSSDTSDQADSITIKEGAEATDVSGGGGDDTITSAGSVDEIDGGAGLDSITNDGTAVFIKGGYDNDTIVNNGLVDITDGSAEDSSSQAIFGCGGDDTITNNGKVIGSVEDRGGNDTIINTGTITGDIKTAMGDDRIEHSGSVDFIGAGPDDDTVVLFGTGVVIEDRVCGGDGTDTIEFSMKTYNASQYDAAKLAIAGGGDGEFAWNDGMIRWDSFETLIDNLKLLIKKTTAAPVYTPTWYLVTPKDEVLKVYENDLGSTLRFFGLETDSEILIAQLTSDDWIGAQEGQILLDVENEDLEIQLIVTMLADGSLQVDYLNMNGELLFSTVVVP